MNWVLPQKVTLGEMVCRDGIQHEQHFIPTENKISFINALAEAGYKHIEATSFSHPKYVPQFKDAEEVLKGIKRVPGVTYQCVTVTDKAVERAVGVKQAGYGPDKISCQISLSESHNLKNIGLTHADNWQLIRKWVSIAHANSMRFGAAIGTVFGCPIEGPLPMKRALEFVDRLTEYGCDDIIYGDTTGEGTPDQVFHLFSKVFDRYPDKERHIAHFHESRGWGLACCLAALLAGVNRFESSLGGIGGQPAHTVDGVTGLGTGQLYTPSDITGLVRSEDLVVMLDEMGIDISVDVDAVLSLGKSLEKLLGRRLRSYCTETGRKLKGHI